MGLYQSSAKEYPIISKFPDVKTRVDKMFNIHKNNLYTEGSIKSFDLNDYYDVVTTSRPQRRRHTATHYLQPKQNSLLKGGRGREYIPKQVTYHKYDPIELKKYLQNGGDIKNLPESTIEGTSSFNPRIRETSFSNRTNTENAENTENTEKSEMYQMRQMRNYLANDINKKKEKLFYGAGGKSYLQPNVGGNSNDNLKAIFDNEISPTTSISVNFKDVLKNMINENIINKNLKGGYKNSSSSSSSNSKKT